MDSLRVLLQQYVRAAWRRRWLGVGLAWLVCGIGWVGVYTIPNQFESSARLYVQADAILTPLLRGIAADTSTSSQLELLERTLLSRPNLEKLISKTDLDLTVTSAGDRDRLIRHLAETIRVTPQASNLFTITYRDPNPKMAHDVVQTLLTIFMESATGGNRADMDNAKRFLQGQIAAYEQQLRAAEKRRADFRSRYLEILPTEAGSNLSALESARLNVHVLEGRLKDASVGRDALKKEVENTPAMLVVEDGPQPMMQAHVRTQLEDAEEKLRMLLLRDTPNHPDVIAQKKLIAALKAAPAEQAAKPDGGSGALKRSVPNPVFDQLKVKLIEANTELVSLRRQYDDAVANKDHLEKILHEQPGLMAEYQNMDRDYGVLRQNYEALLGRLQAANIGQAADMQADKIKLQIVDPPQVPRLPVAPNRLLLITGVLVAGFGSGGAITLLFGQLDTSYSTVDDLRTLGFPVLGGISVLGLAPLRQRLLVFGRFGAALAVLVVIYGGLAVHIIRGTVLI